MVADGVQGRPGADLAQGDEVVLTAGRGVRDDVRYRQVGGPERRLGRGHRRLGRLDLGGQLLRTSQQSGFLVALGRRDGLAQGLLLGAQGLERADRRPPRPVGGEQVVDGGLRLAPQPLAGTDEVGLVAQDAEVDHGNRAYR